jgi:nucleoside-diphosphate-sugar epimerase
LTTTLDELVQNIGSALGREVILDRQPMQPGDVVITYADVSKARERLGYAPTTALPEGMLRFVDWYQTKGPGA